MQGKYRALAVSAVSALVLAGAALGATKAVFVGTPGPDVIDGTPSADVIYGKAGDDSLHGRAGNDVVYGGREQVAEETGD
jgi:Ca2+-binding RTX toxin-like protein